jgi:hypothetical protein
MVLPAIRHSGSIVPLLDLRGPSDKVSLRGQTPHFKSTKDYIIGIAYCCSEIDACLVSCSVLISEWSASLPIFRPPKLALDCRYFSSSVNDALQ